jgi:type IV secretory pathway component VirB8
VILSNALNIDRVVMFIFVAAVASLIALVIYLKRKEPEPYVVIRKETVTVKPDETSPQT